MSLTKQLFDALSAAYNECERIPYFGHPHNSDDPEGEPVLIEKCEAAIAAYKEAEEAMQPMTRFVEAAMPSGYTDPLLLKEKLGCSMEEAHRQATIMRHEKIWVNNRYQVHIREVHPDGWPPMKHLSIKRRDKEPIHDWRDLQWIKNQLVGPECEGMELYPAESRLVDEANQFHLWVFADTEPRFPFGARERLVGTPEQAAAIGAKQRPFEEHA